MSIRTLATEFVRALAETAPGASSADVLITQKGGAPAQQAKRIILARIASIAEQSSIKHLKGESYSLGLHGKAVRFRLATTAGARADTLPWFNITKTELTRLRDTETFILVIWNPADPRIWCRNLFVFCLPPDEILKNLRSAEPKVVQSLLDAAIRKLDRDDALVPNLLELVTRQIPRLREVAASSRKFSELYETRARFHEVLNDYLYSPDGAADAPNPNVARTTTAKIRERLYAILLQALPSDSDLRAFALKHVKTSSLLLTISDDIKTRVPLGDREAQSLRGAYGDGVEQEEPSESSESIAHPYDPTKTKIDTRPITVDLLSRRIRHEEIDLAPAFQRKAGLWSTKQKSQLIESLLIRIPLPSFYFDATNDSRWLVVDGLQRLVAFKEFVLDDVPLDGLEYLSGYNGRRFSELPRHLRRAIEESQVTIHLIQPGTPPEVKFNIFRRVNTGGLALTGQEIRHALNQGPVVELLSEFAASEEFVSATAGSIPTERMADREFVLRFLSFTVSPYTEYKSADMDAFLSAQMGLLNQLKNEYSEYRKRFKQAMDLAERVFGRHAFRKQYQVHQSRAPINKALFEAWSVTLGSLKSEHASRVLNRSEELVRRAISLNQNEEFNKAISQSTADVAKVRFRFAAVADLIGTLVKDKSNAIRHQT